MSTSADFAVQLDLVADRRPTSRWSIGTPLRAVAVCTVFRPADSASNRAGMGLCVARQAGTFDSSLSRQALRCSITKPISTERRGRGRLVLAEPDGEGDVTLIATGSEVAIAVEAANTWAKRHPAPRWCRRHVSTLFAGRPAEDRLAVLGRGPRVSIEAAYSGAWRQWIGEAWRVCGHENRLWRIRACRANFIAGLASPSPTPWSRHAHRAGRLNSDLRREAQHTA